jgi:hypothetical protein
VTLEAVQGALPADATLIEFAAYRPFDPAIESVNEAFGKLRYAAYVVHRSGPPTAVDLGEAETIDKKVEVLRGALGDPARSDVRRLARTLDDAVMRPLRSHLGCNRSTRSTWSRVTWVPADSTAHSARM